jgi:hypothetical protein
VQEIGLKDASGTLFCRGVLESPVNLSGTVTVDIVVSDATEQNGVVTNTGQTAIRDIIADNNPDIPTTYGLGSSQNTPRESDTSLTNTIQINSLNRTELQNIDTPSEFEAATPAIADDSPLRIDQQTAQGAVTLAPVTYVSEAENANFSGNIFQSSATLSNDEGIDISSFGDFVEFSFTLNQDVPANSLAVGTLNELDNWDGTISFFFDGVQYETSTFGGTTAQNIREGGSLDVNDFKLEAGTRHTLRAETTAVSGGTHIVDALFAFDDRFNITLPTSNDFDGDSYVAPELFPDNISVSFTDFNSRRLLTEAELLQTWNDTSNNTSVTINLGSQSTTINNPSRNANGEITETLSVSPSNASRSGSIDITLSRFDDTTVNTLPKAGNVAQRMSFHVVSGNPDAVTRSNIGEATTRAFFESGDLTGNTLRESGQLAGADLLTHSIFADIDPEDDNIIPSEQLRFIPE